MFNSGLFGRHTMCVISALSMVCVIDGVLKGLTELPIAVVDRGSIVARRQESPVLHSDVAHHLDHLWLVRRGVMPAICTLRLPRCSNKRLKLQETRKAMPSRVSCRCVRGDAAPVGTSSRMSRPLKPGYFSACTAATTSLVSGTVGISYCFTKRTMPSLSMTTTARAVMPRSDR